MIPGISQKLNGSLITFLSPLNPAFDKELAAELRLLGITNRTDRVSAIKEKYLTFCKKNGHRPNGGLKAATEEKVLAAAYGTYSNTKSTSFDKEFTDEASEFPTFQRFKTVNRQVEINNLAKELGHLPSRKSPNKKERDLAIAMSSFFAKSGPRYDKEFHIKMIKEFPTRDVFYRRHSK